MLCVEDVAHELLTRLALPHCSLLKLSALVTPELLAVMPQRGVRVLLDADTTVCSP